MYYLALFFFGIICGSFANVCIYRLPKNKSIVTGRSSCPNCKKKIIWYDNIPLLSFILLKSKCRFCKKLINSQYFIVELITAISFVSIYYFFGLTLAALLLSILSIFFIIIFFIDLKHFIIPNELTFPLMIMGFFKSFDPNLIIWLIIFFYKKVRKKEGMGLGDAKLLAVVGFWFGWFSIPFTIFMSSVVALIFVLPSLINKSRKMSSQIPFGPYIIIAAIFYVSFSNQIKSFLL